MSDCGGMLSIRRAEPHEAKTLQRIQQMAFQDDLTAYQDYDTNPACESLDRMLYKISSFDYYTLSFSSEIIGGAAVRQTAEHTYRLSPMYLAPAYQNKGLGAQILTGLFGRYPDARRWLLDTPKSNRRNAHFYEKLGFVKSGERRINERLTLTQYEKVIHDR